MRVARKFYTPLRELNFCRRTRRGKNDRNQFRRRGGETLRGFVLPYHMKLPLYILPFFRYTNSDKIGSVGLL